GDAGEPARPLEQRVVEDESSTHMHMYVCVVCWCQRAINDKARQIDQVCRASTPPSRCFRRLITTALRLVLGLERTEHVAGTRPRPHQLGLVPKTEPHETIEHPNLCLDLARHRLEIGARTDMPAPSFPRRF